MILPPCFAAMCFAAVWLAIKTLRRFRLTVSKKTAGSVLAKSRSFPGLEVPKLLTNTSMRPALSTNSSTMEEKVSGFVASLKTHATLQPSAFS